MSKLTWKTIQVPLGNLKEWSKNPAQISERDAKQLARSLDKFGYIIPFVAAAPRNGKKELPLLDGHQRKMVELQLRHTDPNTLVDVRVPNRPLTEKEKQEAVIRMRSNTGEYNPDALLNWFDGTDLLDWGMPQKELESFGFDFTDGSADAEPEIDRAAELLKKWRVKTGDLWQIGEHRLICGDCTDAAVVARVMEGERANMGFFDPPYGIDFQSNGRTATEKFEKLHGDDEINGDWLPFMVNCLNETGAAYVCTRWDVYYQWEQIIKEYIQIKNLIVWDKVDWSSGDLEGDYSPRHEFIFFCVKGRHKLRGHRESNVWNFGAQNKQGYLHPTQKKIEVPSMAISKSSDHGDIIMDWFVGSGTTLVACQNLNRRGRAIEISPAYCAVTLERMAEAFPGIEIKRVK